MFDVDWCVGKLTVAIVLVFPILSHCFVGHGFILSGTTSCLHRTHQLWNYLSCTTHVVVICFSRCFIPPFFFLYFHGHFFYLSSKSFNIYTFSLSFISWLLLWVVKQLCNCTCNMLRLYGACLFHEWLLTVKCQYGLAGLRLVSCSICGVAMIGELDDIFKVGSVCFAGQTIFMSSRLNPIDHLDWEAARERRHSVVIVLMGRMTHTRN